MSVTGREHDSQAQHDSEVCQWHSEVGRWQSMTPDMSAIQASKQHRHERSQLLCDKYTDAAQG